MTQLPRAGKMAALAGGVLLGLRAPLRPVVPPADLDARRWVRALRRSPVKLTFPSGEVVERKRAPGKPPRPAASEAKAPELPEQPPQASASRWPSTWEETGLRYDKAFAGDRRLR